VAELDPDRQPLAERWLPVVWPFGGHARHGQELAERVDVPVRALVRGLVLVAVPVVVAVRFALRLAPSPQVRAHDLGRLEQLEDPELATDVVVIARDLEDRAIDTRALDHHRVSGGVAPLQPGEIVGVLDGHRGQAPPSTVAAFGVPRVAGRGADALAAPADERGLARGVAAHQENAAERGSVGQITDSGFFENHFVRLLGGE
jgi:hypothetical protein